MVETIHKSHGQAKVVTANYMYANIDNVIDTTRGTTIGNKELEIHTIEHVLAAISGLHIDNLLIEIDNAELPILDGKFLVPVYNHKAEQIDLLENLGVAEPGLEGAMRADGNVSIEGGNKVEIKNIGSFHDLEKALHFELTRQQSLSERDIDIVMETRHWDDRRKITVSSRSKEEDQDYRYFLENDIPWVKIEQSTRDVLKENMPESISSKKERYVEKFDIAPQVAEIIASDRYYSQLFENAYSEQNAKDIANLITTDVIGFIDTKEKQQKSKITSKHLSDLIDAINAKTITRNSAKVALQEIVNSGKDTELILKEMDLGQVSDSSEIDAIISQIFEDEKQAVIDAKERPETVNFLVGKVMQKTKGKADPVKTLELIKSKLNQ